MSESFIAGGAKAGTGKVYFVPKGRYYCEIINAKDGISKGAKTKDKRNAELTVRVLASTESRIESGPEFRTWLIWSGTTIQTVENLLEAAGAHPGAGAELAKYYAEDFVNLKFWADLGIKDFESNGKTLQGNEIKYYVFKDLPEVPAEDGERF